MKFAETVLTGAITLLLTAAPALAETPHRDVPEPNALILLAVASVGIVVGRHLATRKPPHD